MIDLMTTVAGNLFRLRNEHPGDERLRGEVADIIGGLGPLGEDWPRLTPPGDEVK
jgi:hypothetical protein